MNVWNESFRRMGWDGMGRDGVNSHGPGWLHGCDPDSESDFRVWMENLMGGFGSEI